jgi:hypothetical protein
MGHVQAKTHMGQLSAPVRESVNEGIIEGDLLATMTLITKWLMIFKNTYLRIFKTCLCTYDTNLHIFIYIHIHIFKTYLQIYYMNSHILIYSYEF